MPSGQKRRCWLRRTSSRCTFPRPRRPEAGSTRRKPGAILINTARGGLVEEAALAEALTDARIAAAGLDVFASEPPAPDCPLLKLDNVVLAPHVAWFTVGTLERSLAVAVENCRRLAAGEALLHRVV